MPNRKVDVPDFATVASAVGEAVLSTYEEDRVLFHDRANERSILFHVGRRLGRAISGWSGNWWVDLEYNRWHKNEFEVVRCKYLDLPEQKQRRVYRTWSCTIGQVVAR